MQVWCMQVWHIQVRSIQVWCLKSDTSLMQVGSMQVWCMQVPWKSTINHAIKVSWMYAASLMLVWCKSEACQSDACKSDACKHASLNTSTSVHLYLYTTLLMYAIFTSHFTLTYCKNLDLRKQKLMTTGLRPEAAVWVCSVHVHVCVNVKHACVRVCRACTHGG